MTDEVRLREFWNARYQSFSLSESGWLGAGEALNDRIYACKIAALRRSLGDLGLTGASFSVLDAGCGQGYFPRFYRCEFPRASYVGIDISERAVDHLRRVEDGGEFHVADLATWGHPSGRLFDVIQSFEVLHLILDDRTFVDGLGNLSRQLAPGGSFLVTAAMPAESFQRGDYLRYRSRAFWLDALASLNLRIAASRPIYYWLPSGGPANKYARYALARCGAGCLYAIDRAALALRLPQPQSAGIDCRMRLLTIQHITS
jgi:SAM-dependent methyltransferase